MNTWFKGAPVISPFFPTWFKGAPLADNGNSVVQADGTISITFNADGSTLTASGKLDGTSNVVFGNISTLSGTGLLAGTASFAFSTQATLNGYVQIAGTIAIVFADNSTLTATGRLIGNTAIVFGDSSTLTATGKLSGTIAIVFGSVATLHDATPVVTNLIYNRCSPERMGIRRLNIPVDPWKYRRVSPRNQRVYHIG